VSETNAPFDQDQPEAATEPAVEVEPEVVEPEVVEPEPEAEADEELICGQPKSVFLAVLISAISLIVAVTAITIAVRVRDNAQCAIPLDWHTPAPRVISPPARHPKPGTITPYSSDAPQTGSVG
jgi:hypothetical protein